jgi:hypothetical protein
MVRCRQRSLAASGDGTQRAGLGLAGGCRLLVERGGAGTKESRRLGTADGLDSAIFVPVGKRQRVLGRNPLSGSERCRVSGNKAGSCPIQHGAWNGVSCTIPTNRYRRAGSVVPRDRLVLLGAGSEYKRRQDTGQWLRRIGGSQAPPIASTMHLFHFCGLNNWRALSMATKTASHRSARTLKAAPCECPFCLNFA